MQAGRLVRGAVQVGAIGAGIWFLVRTAVLNQEALSLSQVRVHAVPFLLASFLTAATYVYLVVWWVVSLRWWGARLPLLEALRIWFVSNLARFIPGIVWQFAGLVALVRPFGISGVVATGGIVLQQVILLVSGLALVAAMAPSLLESWTAGLPAWVPLLSVGAAGVALVAVVPRLIPAMGRLASVFFRRSMDWPSPPKWVLARYLLATVPVWASYGLTFWLFSRALFGDAAPSPLVAGTAFVASYLLGVLAVLAPGGLVVREAALVATLSPSVGGAGALVLAVASRLWLLALELVVTFATLAVHRLARLRSRLPTDRLGGR